MGDKMAKLEFDSEKLKQPLQRAEGEVLCNELKALYEPPPEGDIIIKVRALDTSGLMASVGAGSNDLAEAVIMALDSKRTADAAQVLKNALGLGEGQSPEVRRMIETVVRGSDLDHETAARISEHFPMVLYRLSQKISELTGQGSVLKKKVSRPG